MDCCLCAGEDKPKVRLACDWAVEKEGGLRVLETGWIGTERKEGQRKMDRKMDEEEEADPRGFKEPPVAIS